MGQRISRCGCFAGLQAGEVKKPLPDAAKEQCVKEVVEVAAVAKAEEEATQSQWRNSASEAAAAVAAVAAAAAVEEEKRQKDEAEAAAANAEEERRAKEAEDAAAEEEKRQKEEAEASAANAEEERHAKEVEAAAAEEEKRQKQEVEAAAAAEEERRDKEAAAAAADEAAAAAAREVSSSAGSAPLSVTPTNEETTGARGYTSPRKSRGSIPEGGAVSEELAKHMLRQQKKEEAGEDAIESIGSAAPQRGGVIDNQLKEKLQKRKDVTKTLGADAMEEVIRRSIDLERDEAANMASRLQQQQLPQGPVVGGYDAGLKPKLQKRKDLTKTLGADAMEEVIRRSIDVERDEAVNMASRLQQQQLPQGPVVGGYDAALEPKLQKQKELTKTLDADAMEEAIRRSIELEQVANTGRS